MKPKPRSGHPQDRLLEEQIDTARMEFESARTPALRAAWWKKMQALIQQRSPQQVEVMERELGLRPGTMQVR
jgi:hypothetical protein